MKPPDYFNPLTTRSKHRRCLWYTVTARQSPVIHAYEIPTYTDYDRRDINCKYLSYSACIDIASNDLRYPEKKGDGFM